MKNDTLEKRMNHEHQRGKVPQAKLMTGSTVKKYPVILDGGKTIIYITDKSKEAETIEKYESRKGNSFSHYTKPRI